MKLFVANLNYEVSEEELRELFRQVGPIKRVHLATASGKSRGFGFVEYEDDLDASRAIDDLHGISFHGRRLAVKESTDGPRSR